MISTLVVLGVASMVLLLYPVPLFPHHRDLGGLSVYSDERIGDELADAMDEAARRIRMSEIYQPGRRYRVFLSHSRRKYAFFCALARRRSDSQALVFTRTKSIIVSLDGVAAMRRRSGGEPRNTRLEGSLAFAVAHEVAHLQAAATLRARSHGLLPYWLSEGWADVTAAAGFALPEERLAALVRMVTDDEFWLPPRLPSDRRHLRWHVLVAYLVQVRGLDFRQLAEASPGEYETWREVASWLARQKLGGAGEDAGPHR